MIELFQFAKPSVKISRTLVSAGPGLLALELKAFWDEIAIGESSLYTDSLSKAIRINNCRPCLGKRPFRRT